MKKVLLLAALAALFYAAFFSQGAAAQPGCCCDPILHNGTFVTDIDECDPTFDFTSELVVGMTCDKICNATFGVPIEIIPPADCTSPLYKPAPANVVVSAVKGKKQLRISFSLPCPEQTLSVRISRCAGEDCSDFAEIAQVAPLFVYTDTDPSLLWNTEYTYKLESVSLVSGVSEPAIATGNPGDIECWNKGYDQFCISPKYYGQFAQYLNENGYNPVEPYAFSNDFESAVEAAFSSRFNSVYFCSEVNRLTPVPGAIKCAQNQQCAVDEGGVHCLAKVPCDIGGVFGMYSAVQACEGSSEPRNYCFFDRSLGSVDKCYECHPRMSCADYRSRAACERDNCNAGNCSWKDTIPGIGIGVCVDSRFSNCIWCHTPGTEGLENNEAYNEVFDQCTERKSAALSMPGLKCVFDKSAQESNDCNGTACMDYNETECGSPPGGIALNPDNSLKSGSTDICGIKVCQLMQGIGCVKNSDASSLPDCEVKSSGRRVCELDHFAPETSLIPVSEKPGRMDWINVRMFDKLNASHDGGLMQGKPGYRLRLCIEGEEASCGNAADFVQTNFSVLNFNDIYLQAGREVLATMDVGENLLMFYGIDAANNPEIVNAISVVACDRCQGPKVIEMSIKPGKKYEGKFYTISDVPVVYVGFNEPATLTAANLLVGEKVIPVTATPGSGANYDYQFIPISPLPDGEYVLVFNAKDNNGVLMDTPGTAVIVVDTTPGEVVFEPPDGTVINTTSVDIMFRFNENEPLVLKEAVLENEVWISRYAAKKITVNLVPDLITPDNVVYSTTINGMIGGKKNLRVKAEDLAGNPTIGKSSFWINTGLLQARMREPSWGVSAAYVFDVVIDTSIIAECKYAYDLPSPVPITAFDEFLTPFPVETEVIHKIPGFNKIRAGDLSTHKLYVYCKAGTNITVDAFDLRIDPTPPTIKTAYAQPSLIIERRIPGKDIFTTYLKVQTDDEGFCKYGTEDVPFVMLDGLFSGFDEVPKRSHDVEINVTQENQSYTYYVACKNTAEMPSATVPVRFSVDLGVPFAATSTTPPYSNSSQFVLRVETNKRAFCYAGETAATPVLMGEYGYAHTYPVEANDSGNYTWYVKCSTGAGNEVSALVINVVVDTTPPEMLYVNDSSNIIADPEYSYFLDRLQLSFLGFDNETAVNSYYYRLLTFHANETLLNWTLSKNTNGTAFYVGGLNLTDGNKYRFEVYPVNIVGLQGKSMMSNGVTIDIEKMPLPCNNSAKDGNEADVDCGGECIGCADGLNCNADTDCLSGFCSNGICAVSSCSDAVKNGKESDIDCGGGVCLGCANGKACVNNSDCASGSCNFGTCGEPDPCSDGILTGTETDVDCGGSCAKKCGTGQ
ncbi:MAG: hypothetical protein QXM31_04145, partial [Candidatus Woesearchaeota archaeon]